jgi:hypothetical protein
LFCFLLHHHRYGHTLTQVDAHTLAVFGGMSHRQQRPVAFSDLWLLNVRPIPPFLYI